MKFELPSILSYLALACIVAAAVILIGYLFIRPELTRHVKIWLFAGLGPLPITAAITGNVANFEVTKEREFCASCHVMEPYAEDAKNQKSKTLASVHSQSQYFGGQSCYVCHADYGMFGTVVTKLGGMHHVWDYYTDDWSRPGHRPPKLYHPYQYKTCEQCHAKERMSRPLEHKVHAQAIASSQVSCTASGCHGRPHPLVGPAGSPPPVATDPRRTEGDKP